MPKSTAHSGRFASVESPRCMYYGKPFVSKLSIQKMCRVRLQNRLDRDGNRLNCVQNRVDCDRNRLDCDEPTRLCSESSQL